MSIAEAYKNLPEATLERISGGHHRRRRNSSLASSPQGSGSQAGSVTNIFAQINIAMIFVFGGENITIFNLQDNASDGDFFFKLV